MSISNTYIDGDSLIFKCSYGVEGNIPSKLKMKKRWKQAIKKIRSETFADNIGIALRGDDNFRVELSPIYKKNRPKLADDVMGRIMWLDAWAKEQGAVAANGWEADDLVCCWAYEADKRGEAYVIAGIDKDLLQYPGNHYNYGGTARKPKTDEEKWNFITPEAGQFALFCQFLTGDSTDNIIGIKGIGPAKANKALKDKTPKEMMEKIVEMYKDHWPKDWDEQLKMNTNLMYMRRFDNDEFNYRDYL
jgi:DNA polymerase-1